MSSTISYGRKLIGWLDTVPLTHAAHPPPPPPVGGRGKHIQEFAFPPSLASRSSHVTHFGPMRGQLGARGRPTFPMELRQPYCHLEETSGFLHAKGTTLKAGKRPVSVGIASS